MTYTHEPLGACLVFAPFNFPITLSFAPMVGIIASGNTCVLKPSELTPHSAEVIKKIVDEFLDNDSYKVVLGGPEIAAELTDYKWDHITYTGNGAVARHVMNKAAQHLTPVLLELGGKTLL